MKKQRGGPKSTLVQKLANLPDEDRIVLEKLSKRPTTRNAVARRAKIVLLLALGFCVSAVCEKLDITRPVARLWARRYLEFGINGLYDKHRSGRPPKFDPIVAALAVKIACEMPEKYDRSQCLWFCAQIAKQLMKDHADYVPSISAETVRRILGSYKLKPWRKHVWLSPKEKKPRDQNWCDRVRDVIDIYTRPANPFEAVYCIDEMTSLQPRPRTAPTKPAMPGKPVRVEHEYERDGALNLFAAFNIHSGEVLGKCFTRKRQFEFIELLEYIDSQTDPKVTKIIIVCDNCTTHHGLLVQGWNECHPRFEFHYTPVHCSWMNQVEQWFSILQRRRFTISNFKSLDVLEQEIHKFIQQWNDEDAHPFKWNKDTKTKVMKYVDKVESNLNGSKDPCQILPEQPAVEVECAS